MVLKIPLSDRFMQPSAFVPDSPEVKSTFRATACARHGDDPNGLAKLVQRTNYLRFFQANPVQMEDALYRSPTCDQENFWRSL